MNRNHWIGIAIGWLITALVFTQLGIASGRKSEREELSGVQPEDYHLNVDSLAHKLITQPKGLK